MAIIHLIEDLCLGHLLQGELFHTWVIMIYGLAEQIYLANLARPGLSQG